MEIVIVYESKDWVNFYCVFLLMLEINDGWCLGMVI